MHPIEALCKEYDVTRYWLAKQSGVAETAFTNAITRNSTVDDMRVGTFRKIANALEEDVEIIIKKAYEYEKTLD